MGECLFFKLSCGCICLGGASRPSDRFDGDDDCRRVLVVSWCDAGGDPIHSIDWRLTEPSKFRGGAPLDEAEADKLIERLRELVYNGHRFEEVRRALGIEKG